MHSVNNREEVGVDKQIDKTSAESKRATGGKEVGERSGIRRKGGAGNTRGGQRVACKNFGNGKWSQVMTTEMGNERDTES
jgi:hypothetical protein